MNLEEFRRKYPAQTITLGNGKPFTYRCYKNPKAAATVVLLTGGIGLSDLFYRHFEWFAGDFTVLTFDYQIQFADNGEFSDAVAELLQRRCVVESSGTKIRIEMYLLPILHSP